MPNRVAFFADKETVESFFEIQSKREHLFEPHYNLTPGQHIPVVFKESEQIRLDRIRWGDENTKRAVIPEADVQKLSLSKEWDRCAIPLSGFYVWKDDIEQGNPFFVRMLGGPLMVAAGMMNREEDYFQFITTEANVLVKPMSETMPLLFDRVLTQHWLGAENSIQAIMDRAKDLFLLTDLSVMRVSEDVNDPSNNSEKLVQPIPK